MSLDRAFDTENKGDADFRQRAEKLVLEKTGRTLANITTMTSEEIQRMLYELLVYQIELELQNDQLRCAQTKHERNQEILWESEAQKRKGKVIKRSEQSEFTPHHMG